MPSWELLAVLLGIIYLLAAVREYLWCWYAAFASTLIYLFLFWDVRLLMESGLQLYYLVMAVYGWWSWRHGNSEDGGLLISRWRWQYHLAAIAVVLALSLLSGSALSAYTDAVNPFLDSFTTWGAVITTWMVARKILENWVYWLVIDAVSIFLYLDRELYLTAALFAAYIVIALFGLQQWLMHYRQQSS